MAEPRIVAHLNVVTVNGLPVGSSMMRLLRHLWSDDDIPAAFAAHKARMRRLHTTYRKGWTRGH